MPHTAMTLSEVIDQKYTDIAAAAGLLTSKSEAVRLVKKRGSLSQQRKSR